MYEQMCAQTRESIHMEMLGGRGEEASQGYEHHPGARGGLLLHKHGENVFKVTQTDVHAFTNAFHLNLFVLGKLSYIFVE